jgi:hypothetical protein
LKCPLQPGDIPEKFPFFFCVPLPGTPTKG